MTGLLVPMLLSFRDRTRSEGERRRDALLAALALSVSAATTMTMGALIDWGLVG